MTWETLLLTIGAGVSAVSAIGAYVRTEYLTKKMKALTKDVADQRVLILRLEEALASQVMEESVEEVAQVIRIERTMRDFKIMRKAGMIPSSALESAQSMWGTTNWKPGRK